MAKSDSTQINIGFSGLLTLIFITLKLCSVINWSWLWVLAPLWIPISIIIIAIVFILTIKFFGDIVWNGYDKRLR